MWELPKIWVPYLGVLIIRILLFRVLYWGPLLSETPMSQELDLEFGTRGALFVPTCGMRVEGLGEGRNPHFGCYSF